MGLHNTAESYGWLAKTFHWGMALGIIGMLAVGLYMDGLELSPDKLKLYDLHKSIGSILLGLVILRITWKLITPSVMLPDTLDAFQKLAAKAGHAALYGFMFLMPITGWMMSSAYGFPVSVFGWFTLPDLVGKDKELAHLLEEIHETGALVLMALIALHVLAALLHHFRYKDNVLKRMLPW